MIKGLNYVRIILTMLVLLFHAKIHYGLEMAYIWSDRLVSIGAIAVTGFFVISGFLLRYLYEDRLKSKEEIIQFIRKRYFNFAPLYFLMLVICLCTNYKLPGSKVELALSLPIHIGLLQSLFYPQFIEYYFNDNWWYLSVAFVLYLLFPIINTVLSKISKKTKISWIIGMVIISEYIFFLNIYVGQGTSFLFYYTNPLYRIPEFMIGAILSDLSKEMKNFSVKTTWIILLCASLVFGVGFVNLYPIIGTKYNLYNIITVPYICAVIICCSKIEGNKTISKKWDSVISYLANLGMSVYLCQSFAIMILNSNNLISRAVCTWDIPKYIIFILITLSLAVIINVLFKVLRRVFKKVNRVWQCEA